MSIWLELLRKGEEGQKKVALQNLFILSDPEYRTDASVFDPILALLGDPSDSVREAAAGFFKSLGEHSNGCCKETEVIPSLIKTLKDKHPGVRREAAKALAYYKENRAIPPLLECLRDTDPWVRLESAFALGELRAEEAITPLLDLIEEDPAWPHPVVQQQYVISIRRILFPDEKRRPGRIPDTPVTQPRDPIAERDSKVAAVLLRRFDNEYVKVQIINTLGLLCLAETKNEILAAAEDSDAEVREVALKAMMNLFACERQVSFTLAHRPIKDPRGGVMFPPKQEPFPPVSKEEIDLLSRAIHDPSPDVRALSAQGLGESRDPRALDFLIQSSHDPQTSVQKKAIEGLGNFGDERVWDALIPFLGAPELGEPANKAFLSVAQKRAESVLYVYGYGGLRHFTENRKGIPKGISPRMFLVCPSASRKLTDALSISDSRMRLGVLGLMHSFKIDQIDPILIDLLEDSDAQVRRSAVSLLGVLSSEEVVPHLLRALRDKEPELRAVAASALAKTHDSRAVEPLMEKLHDPAEEVRKCAAESLGVIGDKRAVGPLLQSMNDPSYNVRGAALASLASLDPPNLSSVNIRMLDDVSPWVRKTAIANINRKRDKEAVEALIAALKDKDAEVASMAAEALGDMGDERAVEPLIQALKDDFDPNRSSSGIGRMGRGAIRALGKIGDRRAVPVLMQVLGVSSDTEYIVYILGGFKDPQAIPALIALCSKKPHHTKVVAEALVAYNDPDMEDKLKTYSNTEDESVRRGANLVFQEFRREALRLKPGRAVPVAPDSLPRPPDLQKYKNLKGISPTLKPLIQEGENGAEKKLKIPPLDQSGNR